MVESTGWALEKGSHAPKQLPFPSTGNKHSSFGALTVAITYELSERRLNLMKIHATLTSAIQTNINSIKRLCCVSNKLRSVLDQGVESQLTREGCQAWEIKTADASNADAETKGRHYKSEGRHFWARGGGTNPHWGTDPALLPPPHVWDHQLRGWQEFNFLQDPLSTGWACQNPGHDTHL